MLGIDMPGADPSAPSAGVLARPDWLWQPKRHVPLRKTRAPPSIVTDLMLWTDPNATWRLGLHKRHNWL